MSDININNKLYFINQITQIFNTNANTIVNDIMTLDTFIFLIYKTIK